MKKVKTLEIKDNEPAPVEIVTKALEELTTSVDERLKVVEEKSSTDELEKRFNERIDKLEAKSNRPDGKNTDDEDESIERKAFGTYLRHGSNAPAEELKALNVSNDEQGGYLAPEELSSEFIRDLTEFSPIRSVASVRNITSPSVKYPKRTGITNAKWEDEQEESEESTVPFGQVEVPAKKLMTYVDISNELLADSGGTAEAEVRLALAEDFGQKEGAAFVNGDAVKQPEGLLVNTDIAAANNGHATLLKAEGMIKAMYSLPASYRNQGAWMMNGSTLAQVRLLKDGDGRFLWQPSFQAGQPETILGRPVVEAVDMPDIASAATPIMFGDFSAYRIVDRLSMSILVNPYVMATKGVTRIHATRRVGGKVVQAARFRKYTMAT